MEFEFDYDYDYDMIIRLCSDKVEKIFSKSRKRLFSFLIENKFETFHIPVVKVQDTFQGVFDSPVFLLQNYLTELRCVCNLLYISNYPRKN